ncbi:MAG: TonB family protein [Acidiphilium sp.]|nr:TonB family protein [Acidiphilium sp.]MDD4935766.1 TonB family protein [Acidiphilium sp.]
MSGVRTAKLGQPMFEQRDYFGRAVATALAIEILAGLALMHFANQAGPVANHRPRIMKIQMLAPPPKPLPPPPKPLPPPPKPIPQPPKPLPPPPLPVAAPKPPPPKPIPRPRPVPHPHPLKPVPHIAIPKPQPPPPPPQPEVSSAERESATARYAAVVHQSVQNDLRVPQLVEMMHLRGVTTVAIEIAPSGALLSVSVARSSGAPPIDNSALASVRATRFPPFLEKMPHHPITFTLQVKLRGG